MQEELCSLYEQMKIELKHLSKNDQLAIRKYMMWAYDRGEKSTNRR